MDLYTLRNVVDYVASFIVSDKVKQLFPIFPGNCRSYSHSKQKNGLDMLVERIKAIPCDGGTHIGKQLILCL